MCVMYYSLLNSSLSYVLCYMLYVIVCIYIYCICACGPRPEMSTLCGEWFLNERISRSCEPCSFPPSRYCAPHCPHCYCKLQIAVGPGHAKRGATCTYLKACSSLHCSYYSNSFRATQGTVYTDQYLSVTVIIVIYTSKQ